MLELSELQIGQEIGLSDGRNATVRYLGNPHFAAGDWVGVELEDGSGKNDGAVQGQRYFDCPPSHGMFIKPAAIRIEQDEPARRPTKAVDWRANGVAMQGRPPSMSATGALRRQSVLDPQADKRRSVNAGSPTPAARPAGVSRLTVGNAFGGTTSKNREDDMADNQQSPSKSPTKQLGSTASSGNPSRTNTPASSVRRSMLPPGKGPRTPMAPPSRPSIVGAMNGSVRPSSTSSSSHSRAPSNGLSMRPSAKDRLGSASGESQQYQSSGHQSPTESLPPEVLPPPKSEVQDDRPNRPTSPSLSRISAFSPSAMSERPVSSRERSPSATNRRGATIPNGGKRSQEMDDLEAKLRVMERKRIDDRDKIKALEKVQADRDKFEGIIQKLQTKMQPQQHEITALKKQLKEEEDKIQVLEAQQTENDTINEMATLDREMAEETAESLKLELDTLRQRHEELELEVEVLREENQELGQEMSPEEKTTQGWLQMERSNERLREALMRLRDVTQQQEADLKDQVTELEQDLEDMNKLKEEYQQTREKLLQSDANLDELRQQLDTALGAEEMIEELTDRNMALNEKMDELRQTIEDLESLKELSDELEINHMETEKQLLDEIDYNEALLSEEARKSAIQDGTIQDLEYTVNRFRVLAKNMQSEIEDMRTSQQLSETEANELSNRSRAMMDLNMRLQVSASKAQVKAIGLELEKMNAQESAEHLAIVQLFLPESFKSERDSVQALLRFRRIGFKANMMHHVVKERMSGQSAPGQDDDIFAFCSVLDKLTWVSSTCERFVRNIQTCDLEAFRRLGGASYELEPVERALNVWIDGLKRDDLKGEQCAMELQRSIALMGHLAEIHISEDLEHYADDVNLRAQMMQSYLENTATAFARIKSLSETKFPPPSEESEEENADYEDFLRKIDSLVSQTRSARVISSKAIRQLEDMKSRSLTLEFSTLTSVETAQNATSELATSTRSTGSSIIKILGEESRPTPLTYQDLSHAIAHQTSFSSLSSKIHSTTGHLQAFYNLTSSLTHTVEFPSPPPPPPWKILAQNMRAATADMAARETELARLKEEVAAKNTTLAMREQSAEELSVKVEILEKRVGDSGGRREKVRELEAEVGSAKSKERALVSKLSDLQTELRNLESEREEWKQSPQAAPPTAQPGQSTGTTTTSASSLHEIACLKAEIATLQSSIRYLRSTSHAHTLSTAQSFLSTPIIPSSPPPPLIQTEAKDVLKEMLNLISQPANRIVKLQARERGNRLKWQPVRETSSWKAQRLKEEWTEWTEWRDAVAKKTVYNQKEDERRQEARSKNAARERAMSTNVPMRLPRKVGIEGQVQVVRPGEWEEFKGESGS